VQVGLLSVARGFDVISTAFVSLGMKWLANVTNKLNDSMRWAGGYVFRLVDLRGR
jgi:hypothetical protein